MQKEQETQIPQIQMKDSAAGWELRIRDRLNAVSGSFCLAKWLQVTLHLHNGFTQSCHHVKSHKISLKELDTNPGFLHNTYFKRAMRYKMLQGSRPKECQYCWSFEDMGRLSDRHYKSATSWAEPYFDSVVEAGAEEDILPTSLEVSFESSCNFMCMYCSPQFSSKWMEEALKFGWYPIRDQSGNPNVLKRESRLPLPKNEVNPYIEAFWKWWPKLNPSLHDFRITGGEPLLSPHTWRVFDSLAESTNLHLNFAVNSNMGVAPALVDRLIDRVNRLPGRIKNFTLYTSIDTVGEQAEYIRYGLDYDAYVENVERVLARVEWPITVSFMMTVNALSLLGMESLLRWIHSLKVRFPKHTIVVDAPLLHNPQFMAVQILPDSFSKYVEESIRFMNSTRGKPGEFSVWEILRVDRVLTAMKSETLDRKERILRQIDFYRMFDEYDRRRNTNFLQTFPQYKEFYQQSKRWAKLASMVRFRPWIR